MELTLTMLPPRPCAIMRLPAARALRKYPVKFVRSTSSHIAVQVCVHALHIRTGARIASSDGTGSTSSTDESGGFAESSDVEVSQKHACTDFREAEGDRASKCAPRPGDQGHAAIQTEEITNRAHNTTPA